MIEFYRTIENELRVEVKFNLPVIVAGFAVIAALAVVGVFLSVAF